MNPLDFYYFVQKRVFGVDIPKERFFSISTILLDVSSSKMTYDLNEKNPLFLLQSVFDDDSPTLYIYLFLILIFSFQGICIIGDFRTSSPYEKALEATRLWIDCGIERGHITEAYYIITHRQL